MSLYDGTPLVKLEGDKAKALAQIPYAKLLLAKVQSVAANAGVSTFGMTQRTEEGYLYALTANGVNRILVSANSSVPDTVEDTPLEINTHIFPDMLSGVVIDGRIADNSLHTFAPTADCRYTNPEIPSGRNPNTRLAVRPWSGNNETASRGFSQYTLLKPSMYSGRMMQAVAAVMGLGRINIAKMTDPRRNTQESGLSSYLKEVKTAGVQVRYDYKWHRTHGIYMGPDGRAWLIEISVTRGVLARPLPAIPQSLLPGFLSSLNIRGDESLKTVMAALNCVPSGETFPNTAPALERLIARGDVLRLLEPSVLSPFYTKSPYSTALGWAFSPTGDEAHNTAYGYEDDSAKQQTGYHYQININLGPVNNTRLPGTPVASGSANLIVQSKGALWGVGPLLKYLPFKPFEPLLPGLLSHDASPRASVAPPLCDTTVFVAFVGEKLTTVKFYYNPQEEQYTAVDDSRYVGECLLAGNWTRSSVSGLKSFPRMMYTNEIDERRTLQENVERLDIASKDLGFDPPSFSDFIEAPEYCQVSRNRVFEKTEVTTLKVGEGLTSVVAIPRFSRNSYYYAYGEWSLQNVVITNRGYDYVLDPNIGYGWRKFPQVAGPPIPADCVANRFACGTTHSDRRVICLSYSPQFGGDWVYGGGAGDNCYEFADKGEWLSICQNIESLCTGTAPVRTPSSNTVNSGYQFRGEMTIVTPGYGGPLKRTLTEAAFMRWRRPSPDPDTGAIQTLILSHATLGAECLVYETDLSGFGEQLVRGTTPVTIGGSDNPTFIGVNGNG